MEELLNKFNVDNWRSCCLEIELKLKKELQDGGLVEKYRQEFEEERQQKLKKLKLIFRNEFDIEDVDNQLNAYTKNIKEINQDIQNQINFNLFNFAKNNLKLLYEEYPNTYIFINKVASGDLNQIQISRLLSIFVKVTVDSTNQSNKSNDSASIIKEIMTNKPVKILLYLTASPSLIIDFVLFACGFFIVVLSSTIIIDLPIKNILANSTPFFVDKASTFITIILNLKYWSYLFINID